MKIKLLKQDILFAKWIKKRDNYTCIRCGRKFDSCNSKEMRGLTCSHFWSRRHWNTRFLPENCDSICYGCHSYIESDKQGWYRDFKITQLGQEEYKRLEWLANTSGNKKESLYEFNLWIPNE